MPIRRLTPDPPEYEAEALKSLEWLADLGYVLTDGATTRSMLVLRYVADVGRIDFELGFNVRTIDIALAPPHRRSRPVSQNAFLQLRGLDAPGTMLDALRVQESIREQADALRNLAPTEVSGDFTLYERALEVPITYLD